MNVEENIYQKFLKSENETEEIYFTKYFIEKGKSDEYEKKCTVHLILVNDYSEINEYYNIPTINFLKKEMENVEKKTKIFYY